MSSPCPRCGETKTESVPHGLIYNFSWRMGYTLRRCSFCRRRRVLKRPNPNRPHPEHLTLEELQEQFDREIAKSLGRTPHAAAISESKMVKVSLARSSVIEMVSVRTSGDLAEAVKGTDTSNCCPKCTSPHYRATRRRWYERLLKRPKMARCISCLHRFPYPVKRN